MLYDRVERKIIGAPQHPAYAAWLKAVIIHRNFNWDHMSIPIAKEKMSPFEPDVHLIIDAFARVFDLRAVHGHYCLEPHRAQKLTKRVEHAWIGIAHGKDSFVLDIKPPFESRYLTPLLLHADRARRIYLPGTTLDRMNGIYDRQLAVVAEEVASIITTE